LLLQNLRNHCLAVLESKEIFLESIGEGFHALESKERFFAALE